MRLLEVLSAFFCGMDSGCSACDVTRPIYRCNRVCRILTPRCGVRGRATASCRSGGAGAGAGAGAGGGRFPLIDPLSPRGARFLCFLGVPRAAPSVMRSVRLLFWLEPGLPNMTPCPRVLTGPESAFGFAANLRNESRDNCCDVCRVTLGEVLGGLLL